MTVASRASAWIDCGTRLIVRDMDRLSDAELDAPCGLPGWTRRQLLSHVASNAEAIGHLLTWAQTGVETPMYAKPGDREAGIEAGTRRSDLRSWVRRSATTLAQAMADMPEPAWSAMVVSAQGRTVPASETRWMRARETCIHAVDLDAGTSFADLPDDFLRVLIGEVASWRNARPGPAAHLHTPVGDVELHGDGVATEVTLTTADAAAWLTGREKHVSDSDLPELPSWL